ncbi:FliM/FliN family flagellar motor switch protein [Paracoccus sp. p1-h21]|uniref:FliM/FliN family flagellar motor switch protein n=1 Tax=Paracoccus sp. p1-h21 TaxID=3366951 RepID=UPI0037BB7CB2
MTPPTPDSPATAGFGLGLDLRGTSLPGLPGSGQQGAKPLPPGPADALKAGRTPDLGSDSGSGRGADGVADGATNIGLNHQQAALRNALCRRRAPVPLAQGAGRLQFMIGPPRPAPADALWLSLRLDGTPAALALPPMLARRLYGQPLEAASPHDGALLLEDALSGWLDAAEALTGLSLAFDRLSPHLPLIRDAVAVTLAAESPAQAAKTAPARAALALMVSAPAAQALARALRRWDQPRPAPALMLRVAIESDSARLSLADLHSLRPGDALVLEPDPAPGATRLVVENRLSAPVLRDGPGSWRLQSAPLPRPPQQASPCPPPEDIMTADTPNPDAATPDSQTPHIPDTAVKSGPVAPPVTPAAAHPAAGDSAAPPAGVGQPTTPPAAAPRHLDALEMRLSFRLGEALMSVADLRAAGPGTLITLDRPDGALVDIVVNGQVIGQGEVVTIAGQKACEIRRIFGEG